METDSALYWQCTLLPMAELWENANKTMIRPSDECSLRSHLCKIDREAFRIRISLSLESRLHLWIVACKSACIQGLPFENEGWSKNRSPHAG